MQASQWRLLIEQSYGNVALLSLVSFTNIKQNGLVVAGFSTDHVHILQNMDIVQFSSSVMYRKFLCSTVKPSLSMLPGHEERDSSRNLWPAITEPGCMGKREVVRERGGWCSLYPKRATSWVETVFRIILQQFRFTIIILDNFWYITCLLFLCISKICLSYSASKCMLFMIISGRTTFQLLAQRSNH